MTPQIFFQILNDTPDNIEFTDTMEIIDSMYNFTPSSFLNGELNNEVDQNNGSCKLFAFATLHSLSEQQTLACFGHYYRDDVLMNPAGDNHQNIRNFMSTGWAGIKFDGRPLTPIKD